MKLSGKAISFDESNLRRLTVQVRYLAFRFSLTCYRSMNYNSIECPFPRPD